MKQCTILGNLAKDIELKTFDNGGAVGQSTIAASKKYKAQNGELKEDTLFIDIKLFNKQAQIAHQYLQKGSRVLISGELTQEKWQTQDGENRSRIVVKVDEMEFISTQNDAQNNSQKQQSYTPKEKTNQYQAHCDENPQEIPF